MLKEFQYDLSVFGGFSFSIFLIIVAFIFGEKTLSIKLIAAVILAYLTTFSIRYFFFKERPDKQHYSNMLEKLDASSFPSLHSMRATIISLVPAMHFDMPELYILSIFMIATVAYSRHVLQRHHKSDIAGGIIIGIIISLLTLL